MRRDILTDLAEFGGRYDIGRLEGWGPWQEIKDRTGIRAQRSLRGQIEKLLPGKPHHASLLARSESRMTFSCHHSFGSLCALPVLAVKAWLDFHHKNTKAQRNARAWCPFVSLSLCLFVSLSLCLFVSLSLCLFVSLCLCGVFFRQLERPSLS